MKGCLTADMAPRGAQGHDVILIDSDDNRKSASEWGSNDTDMVDSNKDLPFITARYKSRGAP